MNLTTNRGSILVVDDDPACLKCAAQVLEDAGFATVFASNGEEALSRLATRRVDVVVSDLVMPHMDGFELAANIQARFSTVPVILTTSSKRDDLQKFALSCGAMALLRKPLDRDELMTAVTTALQRTRVPH